MFGIRHYLLADGRDMFADWLRKLRDQKAKIAVIRRANRMERGSFGDIERACALWQDWQARRPEGETVS
jgi:putative component of toxin-antitoxin plasmid stabilization module